MVRTVTDMSRREIILTFHQTSNRPLPGINNIRPARFWAIMELVESWGLAFRDSAEIGDHDRKAIRITFDDGYENNLPILERLCRMGHRPWVFVPTDFIGLKNRWEYSSRFFPVHHLNETQIRRLADLGVVFGSHGASHHPLPGMSDGRTKDELLRSRAILAQVTGQVVDMISFPFGRIDSRVIALARSCGYRTGLITDESDAGVAGDFLRSRVPVHNIDDFYSLRAKILRVSPREEFKNRIINRLAGGTAIIMGRLK